MAILGNQKASAASYDTSTGASDGRKFVAKHTLASAGTLTELHGWFNTFGSILITLCCYADSSGLPGALKAASSPLTDASSSAVILSQTGFNVALAAGDYWLGWVVYQFAPTYYYDNSGECRGILSGAAHNPPSDPFGTPNFGPQARNLGVWAVVGAAAGPAFTPRIISVT